MEFRKKLHQKIEELQNGSSTSPTSDQIPFEDLIWKIFDRTRSKVVELNNTPLSANNVEKYVSEWNQANWALLDVTVMLSAASNLAPSFGWKREDYKIRRTIQELLIISTGCSPVLRLSDDTYIPVQCRSMVHQYHRVNHHLDQLNTLVNSGCNITEHQMREILQQYRATITSFTNQYVPNMLHAEAIKVRCVEKQYHPISQAKQVFKFPEQLKDFQTMSNWAYTLVGSLLSRSIEIVNQIFLYPQTMQYASLMAAELGSIAQNAVVDLCKFMLWVSSHPPMILVTRTEFTCHCLLLNNFFVSSESVKVQVVSEATARNIQEQCFLKRSEFGSNVETMYPSAGILVRKDPLTIQPSTKRKKKSSIDTDAPLPASYKQKAALNSLVVTNSVEILLTDNPVHKIQVAEADSMLCTDRFMSEQDGSGEKLRDIYYLHCWTNVSVFNINYTIHTLSLPFVIPTRKNQDLQLHRMLKSYSATIFWLHVGGQQDGFLFAWKDQMNWTEFVNAFNVYFMREAKTARGLSDFDFILLREKMKCNDCGEALMTRPHILAFQNIICPHLFYQISDKPVTKHSLWRALLDLIQLFQNERTKVRELWDKRFISGLWSLDSVTKILGRYSQPVLITRISLLLSGSIMLSFINKANRIVHTEPMDQHHLSRRNLAECISDLVQSEKITYVLDDQLQPHPAKDFIVDSLGFQSHVQMRANSDQLGCPDNQKQYTFNAVKLALVSCDDNLLDSRNDDIELLSVNPNRNRNHPSFADCLSMLLRRYHYTKEDALLTLQSLNESRYCKPGLSPDDDTDPLVFSDHSDM